MKNQFFRNVAFALIGVSFLAAQPADETQLKQVIVVGRHSVRAPIAPNSTLDAFATQPFPAFSVPTGYLTANGAALEKNLGAYYRLWLTNEGLLTGNDPADANRVYFRANVIQRTIATAQSFAAGILPGANVFVNYLGPTASDPLFDPVGAGVARLDPQKAVAAVQGRFGGNPQAIAGAYAPELAFLRSTLFGYSANTSPVPATPTGKIDVTAIPFDAAAGGTTGWPVYPGGLASVLLAADPFVMEYADGLPLSDVGWGQLNAGGVSQLSRLYALGIDLANRTPYLDSVQSSNLASHVVRSMVQSSTGNTMAGTLGTPSTKMIVLIASDTHLTGLAGLFDLAWLVPGYQPNYCGPGGALVLELRQSKGTGEFIVRASYVAQTLDQLRNRTPLTLATPPVKAPVFIPGCSNRNATFDCPLAKFVQIARVVVDPQSSDLLDVNH